MAELTNFKNDARISEEQRQELRAFSTELGGDIIRLAERLGVYVEVSDLDLEVAGYLEYAPTCGSPSLYRVVVNSIHSPTRQRFTVAHELAHFVLHRDSDDLRARRQRPHRRWLKSDYKPQEVMQEWEADAFAVSLLMPPRLVRERIERGCYDTKTLARLFGVSVEAMERRVAELGFGPALQESVSRKHRLSDPFGLLGWANNRRLTESGQGGAAL